LWNFEPGDPSYSLTGWTVTGTVGPRLPDTGQIVFPCGRTSPPGAANIASAIGGDYWDQTFWPGQDDNCYLDTGSGVGTFQSPMIVLLGGQHISFLMGGGGSGGTVALKVIDPITTSGSASVLVCDEHFIPPRCTYRDQTITRNAPPPPVVFHGPGQPGMMRVDFVVPPGWDRLHAQLVVGGTGGSGVQVDSVTQSPSASTPRLQPVWGFADLHTHLFNELGFGGQMIAGKVSAPGGIPDALKDCGGNHVANPTSDGVLTLSPEMSHRRFGYPNFSGWPKAKSLIHQQVYVDWLRRAWQGGLRLMVVDAGNSEYAARGFTNAPLNLPYTHAQSPYPTDDSSATLRELNAVHAFVGPGGAGNGWAEIAKDPASARRIIGQGHLALVLGVEVDSIGNYFDTTDCPSGYGGTIGCPTKATLPADPPGKRAALKRTLQDLHDNYDVRHIIPIHIIENAFGYPSVYGSIFDLNSQWSNARSFSLDDGWNSGVRYRVDLDDGGDSFERFLLQVTGATPLQFDGSRAPPGAKSHIARNGLKSAGRILIQEMMRLGMLVDVEHMGERATNETLAHANALGYPVMLSHTGFRELSLGYQASQPWDGSSSAVAAYGTSAVSKIANDRSKSPSQVDQIAALGGVIGIGVGAGTLTAWSHVQPDCDGTSKSFANAYLYALSHTGGRGLAIGTDANGLGGFPLPRFGPYACSGGQEDDYRIGSLHDMAAAQLNGVRYTEVLARMGMTSVDVDARRLDQSGWGFAATDDERQAWEGLNYADVMSPCTTPGASCTDPSASAVVSSCRPEAPNNATPLGSDVLFVKDSYGRGGGYPWAPGDQPFDLGGARNRCVHDHPEGCEQDGWIIYPKCRPGYRGEGPVCWATCPHGYHDDPNTCRGRGEMCAYALGFWGRQHGLQLSALPDIGNPSAVQDAWGAWGGGIAPDRPYLPAVVSRWKAMQGNNRPIHKYVVPGTTRDFDVNIEGVAHYGLLPDWLQDLKNVGLTSQELSPLFMGAEDFLEMWQLAASKAPAAQGEADWY
jgi:hypothetical protein